MIAVDLTNLQIVLPSMDSCWIAYADAMSATGQPNTVVHESCGPFGVSESLLYYDETGALRGILNHFPDTHSVNVFVDPSHQRRGIGTTLLREALKHWPIDFEQQIYTEKGAALVKAVMEEMGIRKHDHYRNQSA